MNISVKSKLQRWLTGGLLFGVVLTACVGCQTFSLSEEDFEKQQRGEMVDPEIGGLVGALGLLGYGGVAVGETIAEAVKR